MNKLYKLKDILRMLKGQSKRDFQGIKVLLEIMDDKSISKSRKFWMIIAGLRGLDLYEVDYEDTSHPKEQEQDIPNEITFQKGKTSCSIDVYECELLNVRIQFTQILN